MCMLVCVCEYIHLVVWYPRGFTCVGGHDLPQQHALLLALGLDHVLSEVRGGEVRGGRGGDGRGWGDGGDGREWEGRGWEGMEGDQTMHDAPRMRHRSWLQNRQIDR
jgi:hypothetical protein